MDLKAAINLVANIKASIVCCLVFVRAFSFIKLLLCKRYFYDLLTFLQEKLSTGAEKVERKSHYGNKGLKDAITELLKKADEAQRFMAKSGKEEIKKVAESFVNDLSGLVDQYAHHVIEEVSKIV